MQGQYFSLRLVKSQRKSCKFHCGNAESRHSENKRFGETDKTISRVEKKVAPIYWVC